MFGRLGLVLLAAALIGAVSAAVASANTLPTNCTDFGTTLASAGPGDTIVLSGLCTGADAHKTLPATANLTIQGAASGTNGFDGTGVSSPALNSAASPNDPNGLTLRNLTFENYAASPAVSVVTQHVGNPFSFVGDTFSGNHPTAGNGGGLNVTAFSFSSCPMPGPSITISGSTFTGNSAPGAAGIQEAEGGGGGAFLILQCTSGGGSPSITLSGNIFSGNNVPAPAGVGNNRQGGGLWIGPSNGASTAAPINLVQTGNLFSGNSVTGTGNKYAGGGEFTFGANLTSSDDRFVNNSLPGPSASAASSEGAGLSTRAGGGCTTGSPSATSTATNLVAAGNAIAAPSGTGADGEGAGIYAGCAIGTTGYHLTLVNSTVAGNQALGADAGAVAGVDGETGDFLNLQNSILAGNLGGSDLGGFDATPANVTSANSDLCAIGASTPFAGSGNICDNPSLANPGPGPADVQETAASPTIDAGSNDFVTTTTDVFGAPRVVPGRPGDAAIVDMGAAEFQLAPPVAATAVPSNVFTIAKLRGKTLLVSVFAPGTVQVTQTGAGGSSVAVTAKKRKKSGLLLNPSSASGGPGVIAVPLLLTKKGRKQLKAKGKVNVNSTVTFTPKGGSANSKSAHLTIKGKKKK